MRHAPSGQHRLRYDEAPDGLCDAGTAGTRGRLTAVAASAKDAATMLVFSVVRRGATVVTEAKLSLWVVLTLREGQ